MPHDNDEPPTRRKVNAVADARASEQRVRKAERGPAVSVATTPAPIDYADMAALLASVPTVIVDQDDVGWFDLDDDARALLGLIDGKLSVAEIAARANIPSLLGTLTLLEQRGIIARSSK